MKEVPWTGGPVELSATGELAMYHVQPGYGGLPATPMPMMKVLTPGGTRLRITPASPPANANAAGAAKGKAGTTAHSTAAQGRQSGSSSAPTAEARKANTVKIGDITAEKVGTVRVGVPGTYQVVFKTPMRVGDALLIGPPVDRYVAPMVLWVKVAVVLEALGLAVLLFSLVRHLLISRGNSIAAVALTQAHKLGRRERRTFAEVANTFGSRRRHAHRAHSHRGTSRTAHHRAPAVIDLREADGGFGLSSPSHVPPASYNSDGGHLADPLPWVPAAARVAAPSHEARAHGTARRLNTTLPVHGTYGGHRDTSPLWVEQAAGGSQRNSSTGPRTITGLAATLLADPGAASMREKAPGGSASPPPAVRVARPRLDRRP